MGYTILIVDDSETIRGMIERTLRLAKVPLDSVHTAANGREALDVLRSNWVDMVLTDIHMPEMDGIELIDAMAASAEYRDIPVAVVSTEGSVTRIGQLSKKIRGYLRKPFTPEKIRDVLISALGAWDAQHA